MAKSKSKSNSASNSSTSQHAAPISDPRFSRLHTDPRFLRPQREAGKVVLDDRFKSLLTGDQDEEGGKGKGNKKAASKIDKFGRKVKHQDSEQERMKRFYRMEDGEDQDDDDDEEGGSEVEGAGGKEGFVDYARGGGELESSGDEESSSEEDDFDDSDSDSDSDEEDEITVGRSAVRAREKKRLAEEGEDDEEEDSDLEVDLNEEEDGNQATRPRIAILDPNAEALRCLIFKSKALEDEVYRPDAKEKSEERIWGVSVMGKSEVDQEEKNEDKAGEDLEPRSWGIWNFDFELSKLEFLRLVISEENPEDMIAILKAAGKLAREADLKTIRAWNLDEKVLGYLEKTESQRAETGRTGVGKLKTEQRRDALSSLAIYGNWGRDVEWWNNQAGCYC